MRASALRSLLVAPAAIALVAIGACSDSSTGPSTSTSDISPTALAYLNQALDWEQLVSYYSPQLNWTAIRADVVKKAGAAQTPAQTYAAITYSIDQYLRPLGDAHSEFWPPASAPGRTNSPSTDVHYQISGSVIAPKIAYMVVPSYAGTNDQGHLDSTLTMIRQLDAANPCGWILDLRTNLGGTWAVMLSALNTFVGNGEFAGAKFADGSTIKLYVQNGEAGALDPSTNQRQVYLRGASTYSLKRANPPVAILQGINTASAGELILLAFRGSATPYRTFGDSSRGVTSTPAGKYLAPDSAYLNITAGLMFDRSGKVWGTAGPADQRVAGASWPTPGQASDAVIQAAVAWLNARPECSATTADRLPSAVRVPVRVITAPEAPPGTPRRVSPFFDARGTR